jgi:8-oxo-dGTP pyrophosphatase MutT (NUDIX family)
MALLGAIAPTPITFGGKIEKLMAHIHTQPGQHDHTASAYIIRTDFEEPKIMLHLHRKIGKYLQFGGHIELHETPWQTVVHELREESGYDIDQLRILQPSARIKNLSDAVIHPQPAAHSTHPFGNGLDHFHTDIAYAVTADQPPRHHPEEGESTVTRLLTRSELAATTDADVPDNVKQIGLFIFDQCLAQWEAVPVTEFK